MITFWEGREKREEGRGEGRKEDEGSKEGCGREGRKRKGKEGKERKGRERKKKKDAINRITAIIKGSVIESERRQGRLSEKTSELS